MEGGKNLGLRGKNPIIRGQHAAQNIEIKPLLESEKPPVQISEDTKAEHAEPQIPQPEIVSPQVAKIRRRSMKFLMMVDGMMVIIMIIAYGLYIFDISPIKAAVKAFHSHNIKVNYGDVKYVKTKIYESFYSHLIGFIIFTLWSFAAAGILLFFWKRLKFWYRVALLISILMAAIPFFIVREYDDSQKLAKAKLDKILHDVGPDGIEGVPPVTFKAFGCGEGIANNSVKCQSELDQFWAPSHVSAWALGLLRSTIVGCFAAVGGILLKWVTTGMQGLEKLADPTPEAPPPKPPAPAIPPGPLFPSNIKANVELKLILPEEYCMKRKDEASQLEKRKDEASQLGKKEG